MSEDDAATQGDAERNERSARRLVRDINDYLRSYDPPLQELDVESQAVVHVLWGWWRWLSAQALVVVEAKAPRRVAAISPLVRTVGEHADLMVWLAATRGEGIRALHRQREQWQRQLWDDYEDANGRGPDGIARPPGPTPPTDATASRLDQELKDIQQRIGSFDGMVPYYVYRSTSDRVHANLGTARVYAPVDDSGQGRLVAEPELHRTGTVRAAAVLDVAVRCCQAAMVFKREVQDPNLNANVLTWLGVLGIEDSLPVRRQIHSKSGPDDVIRLAREAVTKVQRIEPELVALAERTLNRDVPALAVGIRRFVGTLDRLANILARVDRSET